MIGVTGVRCDQHAADEPYDRRTGLPGIALPYMVTPKLFESDVASRLLKRYCGHLCCHCVKTEPVTVLAEPAKLPLTETESGVV